MLCLCHLGESNSSLSGMFVYITALLMNKEQCIKSNNMLNVGPNMSTYERLQECKTHILWTCSVWLQRLRPVPFRQKHC